MITKIRTLPLRAVVALQNTTLEGVTKVRALEGKSRREMLAGGGVAYVAYSLAYPVASFAAENGGDNKTNGVVKLISGFATLLAVLVGAVSILMGLFAAIQFVGSGGNQQVISRAKGTIKNVVIGLVIAAGIFILRDAILSLTSAADQGNQGDALREKVINNGNSAGNGGGLK